MTAYVPLEFVSEIEISSKNFKSLFLAYDLQSELVQLQYGASRLVASSAPPPPATVSTVCQSKSTKQSTGRATSSKCLPDVIYDPAPSDDATYGK